MMILKAVKAPAVKIKSIISVFLLTAGALTARVYKGKLLYFIFLPGMTALVNILQVINGEMSIDLCGVQ